MGIKAGRLRHRVSIEEPQETQDAVTGEVSVAWTVVYADVPAAVEPVSVREFLAARQVQAELAVLFIIRYIPGLHAKMRIVHDGKVYNPTGFLPDKASNIEYLTIPCSEGVNEG